MYEFQAQFNLASKIQNIKIIFLLGSDSEGYCFDINTTKSGYDGASLILRVRTSGYLLMNTPSCLYTVILRTVKILPLLKILICSARYTPPAPQLQFRTL